jgi:nucleoside-diphosphate-sugar epimerase
VNAGLQGNDGHPIEARTALILVTGADGFVGRGVVGRLSRADRPTRSATRSGKGRTFAVGDISDAIDWAPALVGVTAVVHLAARVHVMRETQAEPERAFRRVNVDGTVRLAKAAAQQGASRFVYLSSIKVNGERTGPGRPFLASDQPAPVDAYGISKLEAEQALLAIGAETGMEIAIIRPPLVYGPGVGGNFRSLLRLVDSGLPLPLRSLDNRRSMISIDNLSDLILRCIDHPGAVGTFLASDNCDVSTTQLLRSLARHLGEPSLLWPLPPAALVVGASLVGRKSMAYRLCDSLQVDISATMSRLDWRPPNSLDDGLAMVAKDYRNGR